MKKVMRIGMIEIGMRSASIYISAKYEKERFSMSGVIGPLKSGNALGGCGQIDMEFAHRNEKDNDKRYNELIEPKDINFAPQWNAEMWLDVLDVWKEWHLNDMQAGCEHQRGLGWTYKDHHDKKTFKGEPCPRMRL